MKTKLFVLITVIALLLTACAPQAAPAPAPQPTEAPQAAPTAAPQPTEAPKATEVPPPTEAPKATASTAQEPATLKVMVFESPALTAEFWDKLLATCAEQTGGKVKVEKITSPSLERDSYAKQLLATDQFPDILMAVTVSDFAQAGLLLPFDDALLQKFIIPNGAQMGGKSWTIPSGSQIIPLVYYNKAIFDKVGVKPPTNYQELVDISQKLKDAGETPIMMCGAEPWCASFPAVALVTADVFGNNPDWMKQRKEGKVKFSDPEMVAAFTKFQDLVKKGLIDPNGLGMDFQTANQAFYDGKAAMYPQGSWFIGYMKPEVSANTGVFLWPRDDGKKIAPFYVGGGVRVSSKTKYPAEAQQFGYCLETYDQRANIEKDALFPMTKGKTIADYNVTVSPLYMDTYNGYVASDDVPKLSAFTWSNNDDDVIAGMKDEIYKSVQSVFLGEDVKKEMERLDTAWAKAEQAIK